MTVQELKDILSTFDPKMEVLFEVTDPTDFTYKLSDVSIGIGDPIDGNGDPVIDSEEVVLIDLGIV
jgi:hypothetical protein